MEIVEKNKKQKHKKPFRKLGFTYLETAEIVVNLNALMANYFVFYQKLRNFHWNVETQDFFELHEEFEKEYNITKEHIDIIAERIRVFGLNPSMTIREMLTFSEIKEVKTEAMSPVAMVTELLKDYEILHAKMLDIINAALETGDNVTEQIITDFMKNLEKRNWRFTSWCK